MLSKNFQPEKVSDSSNIHCDLFFIIDKEGNISEIKAIGTNNEFNNQATYALSQIKEKWEPATLNGAPVKYMMKVPLDIKFDEVEKAKFPAGEDSFKKRILENLKAKDTQEKKSCTISFVVDDVGRISKIKAQGTDKTFNKNVERAVSKIRERWTPALLRGLPIANPVLIHFEIN
ncbi:energy transducer TonB [Chryseobacterium turcicum]|uniref:Energy transducer TonB n=1 Tax=Chryseobacterium turcicum TaxID=2898076 RepID=A0A9Q3YXT7_9FLAO|nr:energy transducer TonB [Chryseobacterium turcicum]MCD1115410.1 energy transducer TonB [Chryseobacterium turcicum]